MGLAAVAVGIRIAWIDSRPGWDDSDLSAGLMVLAAAIFGALHPSSAWVWALAAAGAPVSR